MNNQIWNLHASSLGNTNANVIAMLSYIASGVLSFIPVVKYVAWLAPLIIYLVEKNSQFVKFHAMQAFLLNIVGAVLSFLVSIVLGAILAASYYSLNSYGVGVGVGAFGIIGILSLVISIVILVFAIIAMVQAYKWKAYPIPLVGMLAQKIVGSTNNASY